MKPYKHFTLSERNCLQQYLSEGKSYREIAKLLGRSPSTISREVRRNYSYGKKRYNAWRATILYMLRRKQSVRKHKIQPDTELYKFICECLQRYWSPEIIANRCKWQGLSVCTCTIYRALGENRLPGYSRKTHLRRHGKKRVGDRKKCTTIHPVHTIHEKTAIVETKSRLGDFEGDTVYGGIGKGCAVTFVDRKSKLLVGNIAASRENATIRKAIQRAFSLMEFNIPIETITLDNGSEFGDFLNIEKDLDTTIYFVRYELAAVADLMNYAELILRLGENLVYRITEPCEVIVTGNENILNAAALEIRTYACIEARGLVFRYPGAEDFLMTIHVYTQHRVHAFRDKFVILARIEYDPIEENDRVNCLQRTVLPLVDLRQNFVGYTRNQTL